MRTYISSIGYDTRRVTRPVINTGIADDDLVILLRPEKETDTEQASQAVADVQHMLQEIEPGATCEVTRVSTDTFEGTVRECCSVFADRSDERQTIVSLGGGPRDVLLPLTVAALVYAQRIDQTLFVSDLNSTVREWSLPALTARIPERAAETFEHILSQGDWISLSELDEQTDSSKSTIIRHVNDLEDAGVLESDTSQKAKRVRATFSGELLVQAADSTT